MSRAGAMQIRYSDKSLKQFEKIAKGDRKSAEMILNAIEAYAENKSGRLDVKIL